MWPSHTSSNTNPRAFENRTPQNNSRTHGETPRDHKNDPRMQIEILLPRISKKNQAMGATVRRLHQIQKKQR